MNLERTVSVIIPTLNEEEHLPVLILCLVRQSYAKLEVIVADKNSTDRTKEICREFGVNLVDGGLPGKGRNSGAQVAHGEYLLFLDADTYFDQNFIASLVTQLEQRQLDAASCWFYPIPRRKTLIIIHGLANIYFWVTTQLGFPHCIGGCLIARRKAHIAIGGFDETVKVAEDQDYVRRLTQVARYDFLFRPRIYISARRFIRSGLIKMAAKWTLIDLHRLVIGEIRGEYIKYF
ncbi:MAG: glycosyltransferase [Candidatus Binatia bacterium]